MWPLPEVMIVVEQHKKLNARARRDERCCLRARAAVSVSRTKASWRMGIMVVRDEPDSNHQMVTIGACRLRGF